MLMYSTRAVSEEVVPACQQVGGTRSVKVYPGAGALRADITILWDMEDASVYERAVVDPVLRKLLGRFYGHRFENGWAVVSPRSDRGVDPGAQ